MKRLIKNMVGILVVLLASTAVQAEFGLVENFDSMVTGSPNGRACTGVMGGTWDTQGETTTNVNVEDRNGSRLLQFRGHSSGDLRGVGFNGITNTIDNSETGKVFFRFMLRSANETPHTYIGLISDASDNPITSTSANNPTGIPAGFGLLDNGSGGFNLVKTDGTTVLKAGLARDQWYNVWIVANNEADTFDLYLSEAPGPAGVPTLPSPENLVASGIPFGIATADPLNGMIFTCPTGTGQSTRTYIDEIYWDGDQGLAPSTKARNPSPADKEPDVPRDVILSWTPGPFAATHDVYFGTVFTDVKDASRTNPLNVLASQGQTAGTYDPAVALDFSQTYFWRVDEVNAPPDSTIFRGGIWQFTVEPIAYPVAGGNITATASSSNTTGEGPENTINGSGLNASDLHSATNTAMWLSSVIGTQPTWIQYEFDQVYKLHQMWVWNYNTSVEPVIGFGIKQASIEYSTDGANWTTLGTHEFARGSGAAGLPPNTTVDLSGVAAKYVKITANSNWGGILNQYGLSEVRFFYIPVLVREPHPASGATDVPLGTIDEPVGVTLSFRAGREAAKHNVYFSDSNQAVIAGTAPVTTVSQASYGPLSLVLGKTYYWRVDEVNEAKTPAIWQGDVWDFTTQGYFVVDDFEDYNDFEPDRIFDTWIDGWGVPTNGSQVGYAQPPFAEQTIFHSGSQSMPLSYDNTAGVAYSEAERTFAIPQDWTVRGVKSLTLWFRGNPVAFQESPAGTFTMGAGGVDIWGTADEFRYAYKQLSGDGEIVAKVLSVQNTDDFAKAGVMIRNTLDADSANAMAYITPTGRVGWQHRIRAGINSNSTRSDPSAITAPHWVKLSRKGNIITAQHSSDGVNWEPMIEVGTQEPTSMDIPMNPSVYVGLALTSCNAGVMCEAKFSDVSTTGAVTGQWQAAEIGVAQPSNTAGQLYVALQDSANKSATVKYSDPAATTIGTWTEWNIDLAGFTGVNPQSIKKITVGVGDKVNPQPAAGKIYFDDIRLYPHREP